MSRAWCFPHLEVPVDRLGKLEALLNAGPGLALLSNGRGSTSWDWLQEKPHGGLASEAAMPTSFSQAMRSAFDNCGWRKGARQSRSTFRAT
jgi:hypothetical protein